MFINSLSIELNDCEVIFRVLCKRKRGRPPREGEIFNVEKNEKGLYELKQCKVKNSFVVYTEDLILDFDTGLGLIRNLENEWHDFFMGKRNSKVIDKIVRVQYDKEKNDFSLWLDNEQIFNSLKCLTKVKLIAKLYKAYYRNCSIIGLKIFNKKLTKNEYQAVCTELKKLK